MKNWETLCKTISRLINKNCLESELNSALYSQLETTFKWKGEDIFSEHPVKMGTDTKRADFVLKN